MITFLQKGVVVSFKQRITDEISLVKQSKNRSNVKAVFKYRVSVVLRQLFVDIVLLVWRQLSHDVVCYAIIIRH